MIVLLTFIKVAFFIRVFDGFSFLVQMISSVFYDLRYFLLSFALFISTFTVFLSILLRNDSGMGIFDLFQMAFRSSIGDNEMDAYERTDYQTLTWVVWLLIMVVGNIIFMNFIIAVVNESYENCMTKMVAQSYKVKVDMIAERESIMTEAELANREWFPNFII